MTKIIAHRGASGVALENSPASLKAALALPVSGIELDLRRTKDGKIIILHDEHTGRLAKRRIFAEDATLAELQALPLKNGEHLLSIDDVLETAGDSHMLYLDIKGGGVAQELVEALARHPGARVTLTSRNYGELEAIRKLRPNLPFLARTYVKPTEVVERAVHLGATGISLNKWLINPYTYHLAKRAGLEVQVYTVNHPWLMRLIAKLYPDVAIYTDHPERFI
jgi:glycerophosphoryl diester phosphodiesterase